MRTLQSELKRLKLQQKDKNQKGKKKNINKRYKNKGKKKEEKLNYVELMGMNKRGLTRGKGGAWR